MKALYSLNPYEEVEISGNAAEWKSFALALTHDDPFVPCEFVSNPTPYAHSANCIRIRHKTGEKVVFFTDPEGNLVIQGDLILIDKLAQSASNLANSFRQGSHMHFDYQGEEYYIQKGSMSAVFLLK